MQRNKGNEKTQKAKQEYDSDVSPKKNDALRDKGLSMDSGDDRMLEQRQKKIDFTGKDLDVPGRDTPNNAHSTNLKDEENTLYGQGADSKEGLEVPERANTDKSNTDKPNTDKSK